MASYANKAGEVLEGLHDHTFSCYEGTWTESTDQYTNRGVIESVWSPAAPIRENDFVKWYSSEDHCVQVCAAGDDGALIIGMAVGAPKGNVESATARRRARVYMFAENDIIKMECDATHAAIAVGDPISLRAASQSVRHGFSIEPFLVGDIGFGWALNSLAATTAGFVRVLKTEPMLETFNWSCGESDLATTRDNPIFIAPYAGRIRRIHYLAADAGADASGELHIAGTDVEAADNTTIDENLLTKEPNSVAEATFAALEEVSFDNTNTGTTVGGLMIQVEVVYFKRR